MKVFAYVGSRNPSSLTLNLTQRFINEFSSSYSGGIDITIRTPLNSNIKECIGCGTCFSSLKCAIQDDVVPLIHEITSSDIIIFSSPVYFHAVSGSMKIFIDRLSCLTHILGLIGKIGVCIDVSESNGNNFVQEYLSKVLSYLGISVVTSISLQKVQSDQVVIRKIKQSAQKLCRSIQTCDFPVTPIQENLYTTLQLYSQSHALTESECQYWVQHYSDCFSFRDAFDKNCSITKLSD